jgi:general secretion pathway protein L
MAEWLVLQLSRNLEDSCGWLLADERGQPLSAPRSGSLALAAADVAGRRVAVLVPSGDVLMTEVELPLKGGIKAQQVAPYALEEQLASDIDTLHFAVGARNDLNNRTAVAVVTRELMTQWHEALSSVGLDPEIICAEAALLPDNPGHTVVLLDRDTLCVRRAGGLPLVLPADDLPAAFNASLGTELASEHVIFYATPQDWGQHTPAIEAVREQCASFKSQLLNAGVLPLLASQLPSEQFVNLLGGDYAQKRPTGNNWRRWRLAASLALALLVVHVAGLSYELVRDKHNERQLDDAIGNLARRSMPGDSGTGAVRTRIEQRLLASQSGTGDAGMLPALTAVSQAVSSIGTGNASLQSFSYRKDSLELRVRAHDATSLDHIDQHLGGNGWRAEITSGAQNGANYEGRIQARPSSSSAAPARHAR